MFLPNPVNMHANADIYDDNSGLEDFSATIVTPGQLLIDQPGFMRGHGTFVDGENLYASVAGILERVDKLVTVKTLRGRYVGEVGDVIIGRVIEVAQKRWLMDVHGRQVAALHLASVNLPGGILRRKLESDELNMRLYFKEGDLVSAEVQSIHADGSFSVHTRSLKYGKLKDGTCIKVPFSLIKRTKSHFVTLPCGVDVLLGLNGYVWVGRSLARHSATTTLYDVSAETTMHNLQEHHIASLQITEEEARDLENAAYAKSDAGALTPEIRDAIARVVNIISALATTFHYIHDRSIICTYEASMAHPTHELTRKDIANDIVKKAREHLLATTLHQR